MNEGFGAIETSDLTKQGDANSTTIKFYDEVENSTLAVNYNDTAVDGCDTAELGIPFHHEIDDNDGLKPAASQYPKCSSYKFKKCKHCKRCRRRKRPSNLIVPGGSA